jgi:hypothetical protein
MNVPKIGNVLTQPKEELEALIFKTHCGTSLSGLPKSEEALTRFSIKPGGGNIPAGGQANNLGQENNETDILDGEERVVTELEPKNQDDNKIE